MQVEGKSYTLTKGGKANSNGNLNKNFVFE